MKKTLPALVLSLAAATTLLTGCASTSTASSSTAGTDTTTVVASTNVWGSIASAIGGNAISVTSLITSSAQDPHEFEATARDQLSVSDADIVIENGGGYDDFMNTLVSASQNDNRTVLNAVDISGLQASASASTGEFNEHVWYNFGVVTKVATAIADQLSSRQPADASTFRANLATFTSQLDAQAARLTTIKAAHAGTGVAITEPVPLYMLNAAGLTNKTPAAFSEAIEAGTDVSPLVLNEVTALFTGKKVALLAYNDQTVTSQTQTVLDAATKAGIPVVGFAETLPDGTDYIGWMTTNIDNLEKAL